MKQVDARGLSCPEPVVMTQRALKDDPKEIQVLVDNNVSMENCSKFLQSKGYSTSVTNQDEDRCIYGKK